MRVARASNSSQRRKLLTMLAVALEEEEATDGGGYVAETIKRIRRVGFEPDLIDFVMFLAGAMFGQTDSPYVRGLELRCMPYREYLLTAEWAAKREEQLTVDGYRCRTCNSDQGLQVHHRTYRNRGREEPGDLVTLCGNCHRTFHTNRELARA